HLVYSEDLQQVDNCHSGSPGAVQNDLDFIQGTIRQPQRVHKTTQSHDCSTVLIVMENRDIRLAAQSLLYFEASRCRDILQVDSSENGSHQFDRVDDFIHVIRLERYREGIHSGKIFEKRTFSFHYRQARFRTDIAESKYCGPVRHHTNRVAFNRIVK